MISYSTNWMGPINLNWYLDNGFAHKDELGKIIIDVEYAGGRIDIHGTDNPWGSETNLPIMLSKDYVKFKTWLNGYTTEKEECFEQILESYYKDGNDKISFYNYEYGENK